LGIASGEDFAFELLFVCVCVCVCVCLYVYHQFI
jgi:hypothetical protein